MRNVEFKWDKRTRADHKRSFESHRKGFQQGLLATGWKPNYNFYRFRDFDEYTADFQSRVSRVVDERLSFFEQDVPNVEVIVYGSWEARTSNASYFGYNSRDKRLKIGYNRRLVAESFYRDMDEESSKESLQRFQESTDHELKHFIDRCFVRHKDLVLRAAIPQVREKNWCTANAAEAMFVYLAKLRTEGFAQFDGRVKVLNCKNKLELLTSTGRQTSISDEGMRFLTSGPLIDRLELYKLEKQRGFSCYRQGRAMFELIGLAEGIDSSNSGNMSGILRKIVLLRSFGDFFRYYYNSTRALGLDENHSILRPEHAARIIKAEEHDLIRDLLVRSLSTK